MSLSTHSIYPLIDECSKKVMARIINSRLRSDAEDATAGIGLTELNHLISLILYAMNFDIRLV